MLSIKMRGESSEISRSCTVTHDKVKSVEIRSTPDGIWVVIIGGLVWPIQNCIFEFKLQR